MAFNIKRSSGGLQVSCLSFAYPKGARILDNVSFEIAAGARVLLAGATGSGKSTLLRCLKPELTPHGDFEGSIILDGTQTSELNAQLSAGHIGFVLQDPRQQIVMDTVKAELAFGLENLGVPQDLIQRRVAEIANYFGINSWVERNTSELSGGEMQLVNLAAIIAMQPRMLLLDEPTSMLDPIAARGFLELVERVNSELGITILLVEHKQEDLLGAMNQVLYLEDGRLAFDGRPRDFAHWLESSQNSNWRALPVSTRLFCMQPENRDAASSEIPLDVKEGRWWLWQRAPEDALDLGYEDAPVGSAAPAVPAAQTVPPAPAEPAVSPVAPAAPSAAHTSFAARAPRKNIVLEARHVWYRYNKEDPYVLRDLSLQIQQGSILAIVGANASGKSTLLALLAAAYKPQHGKILFNPALHYGMLPQDPTTLFIKDTVAEDLLDHAKEYGYGADEIQQILAQMDLSGKMESHPFDLSGGEQQKLAFSKLLLTDPDVLLLDEPTKGLDSQALFTLKKLLQKEAAKGKTVVMVSHDLEFVAATATECLMVFDGASVGRASSREFFTGNMFYTTALQRITQGILADCPPTIGDSRA